MTTTARLSAAVRHNSREARLAWLLLSLVAIAAALAYADAVALPFHFDDIPHYLWLNDQSIGSIWLTAAGRPYYRPMQFLAWKVYETLFGADSAVAYHVLNLMVHAADAVLVALFARRLVRTRPRQGWWFAVTAGLAFALFPFAYQVVPLPGSFTHPMAALFVLACALAYDRFRAAGQGRWLAVTLACALLAFASNEGTVVLPAAIALTEWAGAPRPRQWRWVGLFAVLAILYFGWYQTRPSRTAAAVSIQSAETILQNAMYALQGLTYPVQPLGRVLMVWGLSDHAAVLTVGVLSLAALAAVYTRAGQLPVWLLSVGWYGAFMAVPVLLLTHDYLINAPRVLYVSACGAAWLWAGAAGIAWEHRRRAAAVALTALLLLPSLYFLRQRMELYRANSEPLQEVLSIVERVGPGSRQLFVNLPAWVSGESPWFPIGHEGVLFLPAYATLADYVFVNRRQPVSAVAVEFNNLTAPQRYHYGVYGPPIDYARLAAEVRAAQTAYLASYTPTAIRLTEAGSVLESAAPVGRGQAVFGEAVTLESARWDLCGDQLRVELVWRADGSPSGDAHVFVHAIDADGTLVAQHDSPPLQGLLPFWQWATGERVRDVHPIDLPGRQPVTVRVGLYDATSGERLAARLPDGSRPPDDAVTVASFAPDAVDACR